MVDFTKYLRTHPMPKQEYDNTNTGLLRPNEGFLENAARPQVKGSINVEGVEYWVSSWLVRNLENKVSAEDAAYIEEFFAYIAGLDLSCLLTLKLEKKEQQKTTTTKRPPANSPAPTASTKPGMRKVTQVADMVDRSSESVEDTEEW